MATPLSALYWSTAAELAHQYEHTLASDQEASTDDKADYVAAQNKLDFAQPLAQTNIRNRANEEGLLTSGIDAQRAGQQQANFTREAAEQTLKAQQDQNKITRGESEAGETYVDKMNTNAANAVKVAAEEARENAEKAPTLGAPAEPGPSSIPSAPKGATNVPGLTVKNPGGTAQPKTATRPVDVRQKAAKRVTG
jgi:hypothetical protein